MSQYTIGDAAKTFYEDVLALKEATEEFVSQKSKGTLTPGYIESYSNFLDSVSKLRLELFDKQPDEIHNIMAKASGIPYPVMHAKIESAFIDISKMLAGEKQAFGELGVLPLIPIIIGVIAIASAISVYAVFDYKKASKQLEAVGKISENRRESHKVIINYCKEIKCSVPDVDKLIKTIDAGYNADVKAVGGAAEDWVKGLLDTATKYGVYALIIAAAGTGLYITIKLVGAKKA